MERVQKTKKQGHFTEKKRYEGLLHGRLHNSKHQGEFWSKMKPLLPSKGKKQSKIILLENKSLVTDTLTVANTFNNYFSEVAVTERIE